MSKVSSDPEIIAPGEQSREAVSSRFNAAGGAFSDEHLDMISRVLDTWFRIPGTSIRFGLDGIVGFIPGIGDFLGGLASCIIVLAGYFRGAPPITLLRMVANLAIEVGVGMVPFVGNLFDIGWRANRRNYHLLERTLLTGRRDTWRDWLFMGLIALGLVTMAMVPFLLLAWLLHVLTGGRRSWI